MDKTIETIVMDAASRVSDTLAEPLPLAEGRDCPLYGPAGQLDSISLVTLIAAVEEEVEDEFDVPVILASEKAMSRRNSPFLTIGSLADYAKELVKEYQNG